MVSRERREPSYFVKLVAAKDSNSMFVMVRIAETEPQGQQNNCSNNRYVNNDNHLSEILMVDSVQQTLSELFRFSFQYLPAVLSPVFQFSVTPFHICLYVFQTIWI